MPPRVKIEWNGGKVSAALRPAAAHGLTLATEHVLGEARKLVPIEEGTLERSGVASVDGGALTGAVSFDTPYAVRQHEDLHLRHDAGREAKYLEKPMARERDTCAKLIADAVRQGIGT